MTRSNSTTKVPSPLSIRHSFIEDLERSTQGKSLEESVFHAIKGLCLEIEFKYAEFWLPTENGNFRHGSEFYSAVDGAETFFNAHPEISDTHIGLPSRVFQTKTKQWIENLDETSELTFVRKNEAKTLGFCCILAIPIKYDDEVLAVVILANDRSDIDIESVMRLADFTTHIAALVVHQKQLELNLRQQALKFSNIFNNAYQFIGFIKPDGTVLELNSTALEFCGLERDEVVGRKFWDITWWNYDDNVMAKLRSSISRAVEGEFVRYDEKVMGGDGDLITIDFSLRPIKDDDGNVLYLIPEGRDISDKYTLEQELSTERKRLQIAAIAADMGIWDWKLEGDELIWDDKMFEVYGVTREQFSGAYDAWSSTVHPEDLEGAGIELQKSIEQGEMFKAEFRVIHPDGAVRYIRADGMPIMDSDGNTVRMVGVNYDITERRLLEEKLIAKERQLGIFVKHTPAAIAMFDNQVRYLHASDRWYEDYGLKGKDIIGRSHYEVFPEIVEGSEWRKIHKHCLEGNSMVRKEDFFYRADGKKEWLRWEIHPWYQATDKIGGIIMFTEVITDKKEAADQLRISEAQFKGAFEYSATGMALLSRDREFIRVNDQLGELLGFTAKQLKGKDFLEFTHADDLLQEETFFKAMLNKEVNSYQQEKRLIKKGGEHVWTSSTVSVVLNLEDEPIYFIAQIEDISDRRNQEQALHRQNALRESIMESSIDGIMGLKSIRDDSGAIIDFEWLLCNQRGAELTGTTVDALVGNRLLEVLPAHIETGLYDIYKNVVETGKKADFVHHYNHDNVPDTWFRTVAVKLEDGFTVTFQDVTTEMLSKLEQEALVNQLTNRNTQLREFSHIISHNLRNPVSNFAVLMEMIEGAEDEAEREELMKQLKSVSNSLSLLMEDLIDTVRIFDNHEIEHEDLNIKEHIDKVMKVLDVDIENSGAVIHQDLGWKKVEYSKLYLESILFNLLSNAIKYRSEERATVIEIRTYTEGPHKILEVTDNGLGINLKRFGNRIFGLHNRFHKQKEGKGIGLFMTKTQIESLGGSISVESEPNQFTRFIVKLK